MPFSSVNHYPLAEFGHFDIGKSAFAKRPRQRSGRLGLAVNQPDAWRSAGQGGQEIEQLVVIRMAGKAGEFYEIGPAIGS